MAKTSEKRKKPCKFAVDSSGDVYECGCYRKTYCAEQCFDLNKDGSVNIAICGYNPPVEESNG